MKYSCYDRIEWQCRFDINTRNGKAKNHIANVVCLGYVNRHAQILDFLYGVMDHFVNDFV